MANKNDNNKPLSADQCKPAAITTDTSQLTDQDRFLKAEDKSIYISPSRNVAISNSKPQTTPRLVIKKIVNMNFKSYAGEITIGPFNERFSSIVGPNGSGKSNIIDSLLFVFGFRASKIRSKRISELIHHSNVHDNIKSCSVAIHFCKIIDKVDENDTQVVDGSDFVISKTAFKDNTSFYQLNGRKAQYKEVAKTLSNDGIDLDHNRFLILQGEVEQISLMKPKAQNDHDCGMLEFLEDIIGTSRYIILLQESAAKLEVLNEQLTEKLHRLRIIESDREQLKEAMDEAVSYMRVENNITKLKYKLHHCDKAKVVSELVKKQKFREELIKDCQEMHNKTELIYKDKMVTAEKLKEKSGVWSSVQKKSDLLRDIFNKIRNKDEALQAELVETNKRRKDHMSSIKTINTKLEQLKKAPEQHVKEIAECDALIVKQKANLSEEQENLTALMSTLKEKTKPLLQKRVQYETELLVHRKNINEAQSKRDIAASELELYTSVEKNEKEKLAKLQDLTQSTSESFKKCKSQLEALKSKIPTTEKDLTKAQKKLEQMKINDRRISAEIKQMRLQVEEKKLSMQNNKSRNKVIGALMIEKNEGRIPGIFGRLGDLGAIDLKYDVAISTACGPLDNVVVDSVNTAQQCIEFLRIHNIGRATFIVLDKIKRFIPYCKQKIITPENVPRLFDLIRIDDERVLPAFYYGLHDTLVAHDLDQATRIAYGQKRHRVVTLKGELIETSGTMSGGGRNAFRGRMGQSVVKNDPTSADIAQIEKTLEIVNKECLELRSKQRPLIEQIEKLTPTLRNMLIEQSKLEIEVKALGDQRIVFKSQIKVQEAKVAESVSCPKKVQELGKAVQVVNIELEKVQMQSQSVETNVKKINNDIEKVTGDSVKRQQKKIAELSKSIDKANTEICRLRVAIKTAKRDFIKAEERMETLKNDVSSCEKALRDIQVKKQECEVDGKRLLDKLDECAKILVNKDQDLGALKQELNELQSKENDLRSLKIDVDQKLINIQKVLTELEENVKVYEEKIKNMKLNTIPREDAVCLQKLNDSDVEALDYDLLVDDLQREEEQLSDSIPNMNAINKYLEIDGVYLQKSADVTEATNERNKVRTDYDLLKKRRYEEFFVGFSVITDKLKEMYQLITLGGAAELELVDSMDPFAEGIVFSVRPPKKSWKNISNLSGGEKTLSSLALVFALHHYKPTPLYFMDEIDAALDFKNVSIVGTYIKEQTRNAQFIVVSLRSEMFELSDSLIGIYKTYNCTKCMPFNIIKFFKKYPTLAAREKELQESWKSRRSTQIIKRRPVATQPHLTTSIVNNLNNSSFIKDDEHKEKKEKEKKMSEKYNNNNNADNNYNNNGVKNCKLKSISLSPPAKRQRRSIDRRKINEISLDGTSNSSSMNFDENCGDFILKKKRKSDVINS